MQNRKLIRNALDWSLSYLHSIKEKLSTLDGAKSNGYWVIGGIMITLSSNVLKIADEEIMASIESGTENSPKKALEKIKLRFNDLIDQMIDD